MTTSFSPPVTYAAGSYPQSVTTADVNGDGKLDLIVSDSRDGLSVLLGDGSGGFGPAINSPVPGLTSVTPADVNGDGKLDLIVGNRGGGVSVLLGDGSGGFGAAATTYAGNANTFSWATADLNHDGKLDIVVAYPGGQGVSVLLGDGSGGFGLPTTYDTGQAYASVTTADVNGDGKPDLVLLAVSGGTAAVVLLGDGSGGFGAPASYAAGPNPRSVTTADVNGDGKLDLVVAQGRNGVAVLLGDGSGGFAAPVAYAAGAYPMSVTTADVNGDGKLDILVADYNGNAVVLLGDGSGGFGPATTYAAGPGAVSVTTADVNRDGKLDLVVADYGGGVSVLLGVAPVAVTGIVATPSVAGPLKAGGTVTFTATLSQAATVTGSPVLMLNDGATATYNAAASTATSLEFVYTAAAGQNTADLVVTGLTLNGGAVTIPGVLGLAPAVTYAAGQSLRSVTTADVNGDGKLDLVTADASRGVSVLLGNGTGGFGTATTFAAGPNPFAVTTADVNGDGKLDLLVADYHGGVSVLLGDGSGGFGTATTFAAGLEPFSVTTADTNGDGKLDLIVADLTGGVGVLLGDGAGAFSPVATYAAGPSPHSVTTADVNGDGKLDLVVADQTGGVSVLMGDGSGGFGAAMTYAAGPAPASVTIADLNGDGKPDLAVADLNGGVAVLLGDGNGGFGAAITYGAGGFPTFVATADVNGDGKIDLVVANRSGGVAVLLGDGSGGFATATTYAAGSYARSVTIADVNGDGRPDLVVADRYGSVSVLLNSSIAPGTFGPGTAATATGVDTGLAIDTTPPVVSTATASPATGDLGVGGTATLTLGFSEAVTVTGAPTLALNDGGTAAYVSGSGTAALVFRTTIAHGQNAANLAITGVNLPAGATIQDAAGNPANPAGAVVSFAGLQVDTIAPTISGTAAGQPTTDLAPLHPFSGVTIGDTDPGSRPGATITLRAGGTATDANGALTGTGLTKTGAGTYTLAAAVPATLTSEIAALSFAPTHDQVPVGQTVTTGFDILAAYGPNSALDTATTVIATDVPCYCRGTLILTDKGEVAIEELAIADLVRTVSGALRPIRWVGRRSYDGRFIAGNSDILPIVVSAGAIADGNPARDLWVSPEHALYLDGLLIAARLLVNGVTVTRADAVERLEYFHVELDTHDVIFADGCAAETYLDHGNRAMFRNAGEHDALFAHAAPMRRPQYAPRIALRAEALAPLARLAARAGLSPLRAAVDEEFTPMLPNPHLAGAAPGLNGSLPTGWSAYCGAALAFAVTETGEEDGVTFIDIRLSGISDCHIMAHQLLLAAPDGMAATHGERWRVAVRARVRAGSLDDVTRIEIGANLNAAGGLYSSWFGSSAVLPDADCAVAPRLLRVATIADRHARFLQPVIQIGTIAGRPIDVTLRISLPSAGRVQRQRFLRAA